MESFLQAVTGALKIIKGRETAFNAFEYQFSTGKPLKSRKLTLNYFENARRESDLHGWSAD
jgi:hypothetical protein